MADLNDLLKRASSKATIPIVKAPKRDFGLKKTMESIKNESAEIQIPKETPVDVKSFETAKPNVQVSKSENPILNSNGKLSKPEIPVFIADEKNKKSEIEDTRSKIKVSEPVVQVSIPISKIVKPEIEVLNPNLEISRIENSVLENKTSVLENLNLPLNAHNSALVEKVSDEYSSMVKTEFDQVFSATEDKFDLTRDKLETKQRQSGAKLETNRRQTEDKLETRLVKSDFKTVESIKKGKLETIQRQTGDNKDKVETNRRQTRDISFELETLNFKTEDKLPPEVETRLETNRGQTGNKLQTNNQFSTLVGLQRTLVVEIYKSCKATRTIYSEPMSIEYLTQLTQSTVSSIKKTIQRLEQKEIIKRVEFKNGRGGWTIYTINDFIYQAIMRTEAEDRLETKWRQSADKLRTELRTELETSLPSKLVSNINNNLLTKEDPEPPSLEVGLINIQALTKFGISRKQIQDISNQKLDFTTHTLQDFIDRFEIYVSDPKNIRGVNSVPAIFVKMAQLASKGNDPLIDVETETDRVIRERIERLKAKQEERLRQENELLSLEFENWYSGLSIQQMDEAAPPNPASKSGSSTQKIILKSYFLEKLWPELRAKLGL